MNYTSDGNISIDFSNSLVHEIKQNLRTLPGNPMEGEKFTIFRVPAHIRQKKKELCEPKMVSIGPYYNGNDAFQAMEKHKWRYLRDYLSRNTRNNLEHCISELRGLESRARRCYFEEVKLQSDQFLMMMLLDGCFIIEFMIKWHEKVPDTIFEVGWALPIIRSDLLLMENQIPFFVIQKLFGLLTCSDPNPAEMNCPAFPRIAPLSEMLSYYLSEGKKEGRPILIHAEIKHILHLYHLCYMPSRRNKSNNEFSAKTYGILRWLNPIKLVFFFLTCFLKLCQSTRTKSNNQGSPRTIPSATELNEAGITFKCKKSENFLDIKFHNGTLEIPPISIEETQKSRLLNLLSFEQCDSRHEVDLTSYACFMGALFKTTRDVALLQEKGIVDNLLATDEELVSFFNWLTECSNLDYKKHYLKDLFIAVNTYHISHWHRWRSNLKRDYFSNPWSIYYITYSCICSFGTHGHTNFVHYPFLLSVKLVHACILLECDKKN